MKATRVPPVQPPPIQITLSEHDAEMLFGLALSNCTIPEAFPLEQRERIKEFLDELAATMRPLHLSNGLFPR